MKKIAVLMLIIAVFFAGSGPILACELCDGMRTLGYKDYEISFIIRLSDNRADAEKRMHQIIAERRQPERLRQQAIISEQLRKTERMMREATANAQRPEKKKREPITATAAISPTAPPQPVKTITQQTNADPFGGKYQWNGKYED